MERPPSPPPAPAAARSWPSQDASRIPYWVYTDPDAYRREQELIFAGRSWCYVGLGCEIPDPGDFLRSTVGDQPVIVVRDQDPTVNVMVNRCAHRGVAFCRESFGNAREFVCPYHQWTYDLKGDVLGVPFHRGVKGKGGMPADFALHEHGLQRLAVAERNGVLFASFATAMPSLEDYLGPTMTAWFDRVFDGRPLRVLGYLRQRVPANWKLAFENIKDPYHASLLHVFLVTFGLFRADQPSVVQMDETGMHSILASRRGERRASRATAEMRSFRGDLTLKDPRLLEPVREFPGEETVVMQTIWPNLIVQQQSNTLATRRLVPRGPGQFDLHWTFFGYADDDQAMTTRRLRQANLMGPSGLVSVDDSEVLAMAQQGVSPSSGKVAVVEMGGRSTDDTEHMVTEAAIRAFYVHYRRVMGF